MNPPLYTVQVTADLKVTVEPWNNAYRWYVYVAATDDLLAMASTPLPATATQAIADGWGAAVELGL